MPTPIPVSVKPELDRNGTCPHCTKAVRFSGHEPDFTGLRRALTWHGYESLLKCPDCGKLAVAWKQSARLAMVAIYGPMVLFFGWLGSNGFIEGAKFAEQTGGPVPAEAYMLAIIGTSAAVLVAFILWRITRPIQKDGGRLAEVDGKLQWDYAPRPA